jgi:hypothetical protein
LSGAALSAEEDRNSPRLVQAYKINSNIQLDGLLTEAYWQQASVASDFRQIQPEEGQPATERTEVRILYDNHYLYVGVVCFDSEVENIVAQKLQRDSGVEDDDMFAFVLDTYHDHRNAYYFATNPNGVEEDGQVVDGAFRANLDWDGVWEVKSKIQEQGWSAEFKIPLWNLRFTSLPEQTWGINFTRIIKRKTEQVNWSSWSRDNGGFLRISRAGDLLGLTGLNQSFNLQVKPYALGKSRRDNLLGVNHVGDESFDAGVDIKYGLTSNLTLDLTVNTDFAQVEADVEQINLTRFPLFFPEKREFFLESASIFQFGERGFFERPPLLLFFSRRIGIEGFNTIVPILAGGRITGKVGNYNVGLLDILADDKSGFPKSHFSVARVSRDIFQRSKVGVIFTNRADFGQSQNRAYGADANIWLSNVLEFQSFFAQTHTTGTGNTDRAWKLALDFTKDHWGWFASHMFIDKNFDPAVGFVLRRDIRRSRFAFRVSPQPNGRILRRTNIRQSFNHITNKNGRLQDWSYGIIFMNELSTGDFIDFGYGHIFERLDRVFNFRPDIQIPIGDYNNHQLNADFQTSAKRKFAAFAYILWRQFYSGELLNWGSGFSFVPNRHVSIEMNYDRNEIDLPQGTLNTDLLQLRLNVAFTTHLFLNTLIQYNSETNELSTNMRLNFIHSPGSDLFIVFNESRGREGETFFDGLPARNREIILKFTRFLRM